MTPEQIKDRMKAKGLREVDLVRRFKTSTTTIHFLVRRKLTSDRLEKKLARALGVKLEELRGENRAA